MDSGMGSELVTPTPSRAARRRYTVSDKMGDIIVGLRGTFDQLNGLWDQVDMDEEMRVQRVNSAFSILRELQEDMVKSEQTMVQGVHTQIENGLQTVDELRAKMSMGAWDPMSREKKGSLKLWKEIEQEMNDLKVQFEERSRDQAELFQKMDLLAFRIGEDVNELIPQTKDLLSPASLGVLVARSNEMSHVLNERMSILISWQDEVKKAMKRMDRSSRNDEIVEALLNADVNDDGFVLSTATMEMFKEAVDGVNSELTAFIASIEFEYIEKVMRLSELWELCCVPISERIFDTEFNSGKHGATEIKAMGDEIEILEKQYESRRVVYEKFNLWKQYWEEKVSMEEAEKNPGQYTNRGCELEKRLQRSKQLQQRLLPNAERDVSVTYSNYLEEHPNDEIFFEGLTPPHYIDWQKKTREEEKALEKIRKRAVPVSNQRTPVKTRLLATPQSMSKLPNALGRLGNKLDTTQLSCIGPCHPSSPGPKTSSPKRAASGSHPCSTPLKKMFSTPVMSPMKHSNRKM